MSSTVIALHGPEFRCQRRRQQVVVGASPARPPGKASHSRCKRHGVFARTLPSVLTSSMQVRPRLQAQGAEAGVSRVVGEVGESASTVDSRLGLQPGAHWLDTRTRKRGVSTAPGVVAGMASQVGHLRQQRLWTPEELADATIGASRFLVIVSSLVTRTP
jgi:hypothetical protein